MTIEFLSEEEYQADLKKRYDNMSEKQKHHHDVLSEIVAQMIDEETNSNDLAFLVGSGELPIPTEEQKKSAMVSKKFGESDIRKLRDKYDTYDFELNAMIRDFDLYCATIENYSNKGFFNHETSSKWSMYE